MKKKKAGNSEKRNDYKSLKRETINTDPDGSWTGVSTEDPMSKPIQDADDL